MTGAAALPPAWSLTRPKPAWQWLYDFVAAPLRMVALPDRAAEGLHLTSLRAERFARVLERIEGRCLDIGAGDNALVRLYRARAPGSASAASVGVDVVDWGGDALVVQDSARLPFTDGAFDTACFVACLNHIPARDAALSEALRVLRPGGRLIVTMIGRRLGALGHAVWWYSEDKHRDVAPGETGGLDPDEVRALIAAAGFTAIERHRFVYGLNGLFVARRPPAA